MVLLFFVKMLSIPLMLWQLLITLCYIYYSLALMVSSCDYSIQLGAILYLYTSAVNMLLLQNLMHLSWPLLVALPSRFSVLVPL